MKAVRADRVMMTARAIGPGFLFILFKSLRVVLGRASSMLCGIAIA